MSVYFKYIRNDIAMKCSEEEYMKHNKKRRILLTAYAVAAEAVLMTGFTSLAAEARAETPKVNNCKQSLSDGTFPETQRESAEMLSGIQRKR